MTDNVVNLNSQLAWIVGGAVVLMIFAVAVAWTHRSQIAPGSRGHRPQDEESGHETIRPDGYVDSFANDIEEAGGGLPPLVKLAIPGILLSWLLYLIFNWTAK